MYDFKFGGGSLGELFGMSTSRPPREVAEYDFTLLDIAGKSGSEYIDNHRYKNVEISREIGFINRDYHNIPDIAEKVIDWLAYQTGYRNFEDTDHPDMVTKAVLQNFSEIQIQLRRIYKAKLKFSRLPFWYKKSSLEPTTIASSNAMNGVNFNNPYPIGSEPLIVVVLNSDATGNLSFSIGGTVYTYDTEDFKVNGTLRRFVFFDLEDETVSIATNISADRTYIDVTVPIGFSTGSTEVKLLSNNVTNIQVTPRWRCL